MKIRLSSILFKYSVVIVIGLFIFLINDIENVPVKTTVACVLLFSAFKSLYAAYFLVRKIIDVSAKNIPYHKFLLFMAMNVALIILSFSIDFFCLSEVDPKSFSGVSQHLPFYQRYLDFLYFSILAFTNFGYDKISPDSFGSKFLMSSELLISFATIIFILSDFISLKESLSNSQKKDG